MRITRAGTTVEPGPLGAAIIGWVLDHETDLQARNTGTITVNFASDRGMVDVAFLGRDSLKYQPKGSPSHA